MNLSKEQKLLVYAVSHQYVLLGSNGDIDGDVKLALCGAFNANKIAYKIPNLIEDINLLARTRFIEKNLAKKRFDVTVEARSNYKLVLFDEKKEDTDLPPEYVSFMKTFWVVFCSFIKGPLADLIVETYNSESKQLSELTIASDIATGVLCDLAVKRGLIVKDSKGVIVLTQDGIDMAKAEIEARKS